MQSFLTSKRFQSIILDRSVKIKQKKKMKRKNPWATNNTVVYKNIQQLSVGECFSVLLFLLLIIKKNNEDRFETKAKETRSIHGLFFPQSFFFFILSASSHQNQSTMSTDNVQEKSNVRDELSTDKTKFGKRLKQR